MDQRRAISPLPARLGILAVLCCASAGAVPASPPSVLPSGAQSAAQNGARKDADSGTFLITVDQNKMGTEKFTIKPTSDGWETNGELQLEAGGKKTLETSILRMSATWHPLSYERVQTAPAEGKLTAKFGASETMLEMAAKDGGEPFQQSFFLPKNDLVVLDTNFFHHYEVLLRLYDRARGETQPFNVFIPQEALPGTISLQFVASENAPAGKAGPLDHFRAITDTLQIELWATGDGAIQRISIPDAKLEVVRQ